MTDPIQPELVTVVDGDDAPRRSEERPGQNEPVQHQAVQTGSGPVNTEHPGLSPDEGPPPTDRGDGEDDDGQSGWRWLLEWSLVLTAAVVAALIMRALVFQVFYIPSASMEPTLSNGDRVAVNKRETTPERGDIMVFERPPNSPPAEINDLIKRTIALPGETIVIEGGQVFIDDQVLFEPYLPEDVRSTNNAWTAQCANERGDGSACLIPDDHYFMMGDNRANSWDSTRFGPIHRDLFVGRAILRVWPLSKFGRL
ncbi:MAG: signal peptidase I [Acidimicrobiales bacterium]|nr:signal peptidase I [Acidimicrobiales bacterium]